MPLAFGWSFETDVGWDDVLSLAQELDRNSPFDQVWVTDALVGRTTDGPRLDSWTMLAALAQATTRVRLGVHVTGAPFRHPAVLAKIATTVDHISGGRLNFGIGAGWPGENLRLGVPFYGRRERLERLDETLQVLKLLWTQPQPSFEGRHFRLDAAPFSPPPLQQPHPPIYVGGSSDAILRITAKYADAANVEPKRHDALDRCCREIGRDRATLRRTHQPMLFLNEDRAFQRGVIERVMSDLNLSEEDARRAVLLGSPAEIKAQIEAFAEAGVEEIVVWQVPRIHKKSLLRFWQEVIPAFR